MNPIFPGKPLLLIFISVCLLLGHSASAEEESGDNLLESEDLAVLCAAMYEYQLDLDGFEINLLETKRHLIGQHMLNIPDNPHIGDKQYFEAKVEKVKTSFSTMSVEQKAELEHDKWTEAGNPCDQIVAVTFILTTAETINTGIVLSLDDARIIMKKIYPWEDRYSGILEKGLVVQYEKASRGKSVP